MLKLKLSRKKTTLSVTKKKYNALKLLVEIQLTNWMNRLLTVTFPCSRQDDRKKIKTLGPLFVSMASDKTKSTMVRINAFSLLNMNKLTLSLINLCVTEQP